MVIIFAIYTSSENAMIYWPLNGGGSMKFSKETVEEEINNISSNNGILLITTYGSFLTDKKSIKEISEEYIELYNADFSDLRIYNVKIHIFDIKLIVSAIIPFKIIR